MVERLLGKTMRARKTVTVGAAAMSAALGLVWCVAVIGHLFLLRFPLTRTGLDVSCVDD